MKKGIVEKIIRCGFYIDIEATATKEIYIVLEAVLKLILS